MNSLAQRAKHLSGGSESAALRALVARISWVVARLVSFFSFGLEILFIWLPHSIESRAGREFGLSDSVGVGMSYPFHN